MQRATQASPAARVRFVALSASRALLALALTGPLPAQQPAASPKQPISLNGAKCTGSDTTDKYDAIIVGAGLAGITAARDLQQLHRSILLLEANDRIGGRGYVGYIGPDALPPEKKIPIDYGGAWLHDEPQDPLHPHVPNPLKPEVARMKLERTPTDLDAPFYIEGVKASLALQKEFKNAVETYENDLEAAANAIELPRSLCSRYKDLKRGGDQRMQLILQGELKAAFPSMPSSQIDKLAYELTIDSTTEKSFCEATRKKIPIPSDKASDHLPSGFANVLPLLTANSGPLESAVELHQSSVVDSVHFASGDDEFVNKSLGYFVTEFGKHLPVCLNSAVTKIDYTGPDVKVWVGDRSYVASDALVTVSVGILKKGSIDFAPKLPPSKLDAINGLQMGNMQKVIIPFNRDIFYDKAAPNPNKLLSNSWMLYEGIPPPEALALAHQKHLPLTPAKDRNPHHDKIVMAFVIKPLNTNIAVGFFGGAWAETLESKCDGQTTGSGPKLGCDKLSVAIARAALEDVIGVGPVKQSINDAGIHVTHWSLDPTSFGAYSAAKPENWDKRQILAEPVRGTDDRNHLFFAGEAESLAVYNGSYPGAYTSGKKAAQEINDSLLAEKPTP